MAKAIIMPKFEMAQEDGTVSQWLKNEGDQVKKGDIILEVETDKVNMEVEAPTSGTLAGISAQPGQTVPIGVTIAWILKPGESLPEPQAKTPAFTDTAPAQTEAAGSESAPRATPVAERIAKSHGVNLQSISTAGERITKADVESHLSGQSNGAATQTAAIEPDKIRAVPAARRLARELGVDLVQVRGSGPDGRIQSVDVEQAAKAAASSHPASIPAAGELTVQRTVPLSSMRRTIANRLTASVQEAPQFTVSMDVALARAMQIVDDLQAVAGEQRVTLTAFLVKACAWALARHPNVNASFGGDSITEWAEVNVGVAVTVEQGLLVPVIKGADRLSGLEIAIQLSELGQRAREGKLRSDELQGGTFTISNLGMFGVDRFTAIINPPQAAILAVSRAAKRPVVLNDDRIEVRLLADFTLTADHRVIDGAQAGQFLADLKQVIERPGALL